jgi:hypothetical protein
MQDPLKPAIVGSIKPAQRFLKIAAKLGRDAQNFAVDAGIEAFHPTIRSRRAGPGVTGGLDRRRPSRRRARNSYRLPIGIHGGIADAGEGCGWPCIAGVRQTTM